MTRPEIKVGDMVRIRVKPIESRGSYRVNKIAWSEKVYRVVSAKSGEMGRGGRKAVHRDLRKVPKNSVPEPRGLEVQSRQRRLQRGPRFHHPFDALCASTRLYVSTADSSARHSLMSSSASGWGLLGKPSSSSPRRARHVIPASSQRRASSARCARVAGVRRAVKI